MNGHKNPSIEWSTQSQDHVNRLQGFYAGEQDDPSVGSPPIKGGQGVVRSQLIILGFNAVKFTITFLLFEVPILYNNLSIDSHLRGFFSLPDQT